MVVRPRHRHFVGGDSHEQQPARTKGRIAILGATALVALAVLAPIASAGIPSPSNSTVPAGIRLVGAKNGVPDPDGLFSVIVRDMANNPMPNVPVDIEFEAAPDLSLGATQPHPGVTVTCGDQPRARAFTDGTGTATFILLGSAANRYTQPGTIGGQVKVRAAGTQIATVIGTAVDQDGANGVDLDDVSLWLCDFGSGQPYARSDYDVSGSIGAIDLSLLIESLAGGNSAESATPCGTAPQIAPTTFLVGGLSLGWDDCRQLSSGADKVFACNTNTGSMRLVGSLTPRTDLLEVSGLEAIIDIVNPAGTLPDWWRFQTGGCRNGVSVADPNSNPSLTCSISGMPQIAQFKAIYPFNGDPSTLRLHVVVQMDGGTVTVPSTDQMSLLELVVNRTKTVGTGACSGCNVPVDIILRSMRVSRGDPCTVPPEARPGDIVFNATTGVNVAHWQQTTPTFPISIDASALDDPDFRVSVGPCFPSNVVQNFQVVPGAYAFISCTGGQVQFEVDANGLIQYDPSFEGLLTGAGTTTLGVGEAPVTVDAHLAPAWTYEVDSGSCFNHSDVQAIQLFPGDHSIGICSGTCPIFKSERLDFRVDGDGKVQYDPVLEGALTGAGSSTVTLRSFTFPSTQGDDVAPSMGLFRVVVEPEFWTMMTGYPGFAVVNGVHRLVSPVLSDFNTIIGRSMIHQDGDVADAAGVPVGSAGTVVSDTHMPVVPPGFAGPPGTAEVHTEIRSMNMTGPLGAAVRAGIHAPDQPISAGEIEANPGQLGLFPAESFFNVFVEVDMPILGTLYNSNPLLVENYGITCFPPEVVYMHKHTGPVPILFKVADTQVPPRWAAGQRFGWLVLAGHGMNMDANPSPASGRAPGRKTTVDPFAEFAALVNAEPEMADPATIQVDVKDVVTFASPSAFTDPAYADSLENGINLAAALGEAGNPCAGLFESTRMYQRVDSLTSVPDWVTDHAVRRVLADRFLAMSTQLLAQANQTGGCPGTTNTPPKGTPSKLALLGIQPNPSFGRTSIRYALPKSDRVSLMVFDVSGRHVRTLVDGELAAGTYEAVWDGHQDRAGGRAASSGTYFIRLAAGGKLVTRRMVLIR